MSARVKISVIEGDGIGPEIVREAVSLLDRIIDAEFIFVKAGKSYFYETGEPIEEGGMEKIRESDALLKGPIATPIRGQTYPSINLRIRKEFDLYANIRPFRSYKGISIREVDMILVRENTEGLYSGVEEGDEERVVAHKVVTRRGSERVAEYAFHLAVSENRKRVTVAHKANVLKRSDGLFMRTFFEVARKYPSIKADDVIVDAAAYKLVKVDRAFDVLVTPNLYGDILSDVAAGVIGSLGLCGSAQIGDRFAAFEPIHGTAEDIAGKGIANPLGIFMASSMLLKWLGNTISPYYAKKGDLLQRAICKVVNERIALTPDLGGDSKTEEVTEAVINLL